jgi:Uncharacterized conserved protein (DUF2039)
MPGGKSTAGFTKSANKVKFVRNRDVKLKDNELKKEANIARLMCEGVCARCRAKVQWRFQYNKYKPLKNLANCQNCKQKCVTKAYRTWCDKCASSKKACSSCCEDMETANALYKKETDEKAAAKAAAGGGVQDGDGDGMALDDDGDDGDDDDDDGEEGVGDDGMEEEAPACSSSSAGDATNTGVAHMGFDERKFAHIAASKYSKDRKTGTAEDSVFKFEAAAAATAAAAAAAAAAGTAAGGPSSSSSNGTST